AAAAAPAAVQPLVGQEAPRRGWIPVLVAVAVLAALLAYLLLPGILLYPPPPAAADPQAGNERAAREAAIRALERRAESLRGALARNQCIAQGDPVIPDPSHPGVTLLPPVPDQTVVPPAPGGPRAGLNHPDLLRQAPVLTIPANAEGVKIGSGFVVAPRLIVTNNHVIESADPDKLFVTNQKLGGVKPARVVVHSPGSQVG